MTNRRDTIHARAQIRGTGLAPRLAGEASFTQKQNGVLVTVRVVGLPLGNPTGFFALHIHEGASCDGGPAGGYFNPDFEPSPRRAGDLPPLLSCGSEAYLSVLTNRFTVREVIGKTVVIHPGGGELCSRAPENFAKKIACGVITRGPR